MHLVTSSITCPNRNRWMPFGSKPRAWILVVLILIMPPTGNCSTRPFKVSHSAVLKIDMMHEWFGYGQRIPDLAGG